jgi:hypothetical protein
MPYPHPDSQNPIQNLTAHPLSLGNWDLISRMKTKNRLRRLTRLPLMVCTISCRNTLGWNLGHVVDFPINVLLPLGPSHLLADPRVDSTETRCGFFGNGCINGISIASGVRPRPGRGRRITDPGRMRESGLEIIA